METIITAMLFAGVALFAVLATLIRMRWNPPLVCCRFCGRPVDPACAIRDRRAPFCSIACWEHAQPQGEDQ
jgi:recombinational DNA repair protein (RecF pathway)